jgi:hypothetical protein
MNGHAMKRKRVSRMRSHGRRLPKMPILTLGPMLWFALVAPGLSPAQAPAGSTHRVGFGPTGRVRHTNALFAVAASAISLNESGELQLTSRRGFTLNERGSATGTVKGTIYVHLRIVSASRVSAEINIYPTGGSITGYGTAGYRRDGATGTFSGSLSIVRGSGSYSHAHGSGLDFTGTIRRSDYAVTVHVRGTVID